MPKHCYKERRFAPRSLAIIERANTIIEEYVAQGFDLTLRQLYYQFVARDLLANDQRSYKRLGSIINDARLAGLIDWRYIVDRTRNLCSLSHWDSPAGILASAVESYRIDLWQRQPHRIEVWIEKDALSGVFQGICEELDVPYFSCRGYASQSAVWRAGRRLLQYARDGQAPIVFHFGDHDPSGMDMTRDNQDRLDMFAQHCVEVRRLALNWDQIEEYNPPPNPAKLSDSRATGYIAEYGSDSWELDAMEPAVLARLVEDAVLSLRDDDLWDEDLERQEAEREDLKAMAEDWKAEVEIEHGRD